MSTNQGRVYFALDGDQFDPDHITKHLGILPTSVMKKHERIPNKLPKISSWQLSTKNIIDDFVDVYDMASTIVNQLKPKKPLILSAIQAYDLTPRLQVVLWFNIDEACSTPAIGFDTAVISFLGQIGASIDIDTYKH